MPSLRSLFQRKVQPSLATFLIAITIISALISWSSRSLNTFPLQILLPWLALTHLITYHLAKYQATHRLGKELVALVITFALILIAHLLVFQRIIDSIDNNLLSAFGELIPRLASKIALLEQLFEKLGFGSYSQLDFLYKELLVLLISLLVYPPIYIFWSLILAKLSFQPTGAFFLNDSVIKRTTFAVAIFSFLPVLIQYTYNRSHDDAIWQLHAAGSPLWLVIFCTVHFCYTVLFRYIDNENSTIGMSDIDSAEKSIKPVFNSYNSIDILSDYLISDWNDHKTVDRETSVEQESNKNDVGKLINGKTIFFEGAADQVTYLTLINAISSVRDRGEMTLVICPNQCARAVFGRLKQGPLAANEHLDKQRELVLTEAYTLTPPPFDTEQFYDLVVAEEQQFQKLLNRNKGTLSNSIGRTGLFVFLDFHRIDASLVYLALNTVQQNTYSPNAGVFFQSLNRIGLSTQLNRIETALGRVQTMHDSAHVREPVTSGHLMWRSCVEFRERLITHAGIESSYNWWPTPPYLFLDTKDDAAGISKFQSALVDQSGIHQGYTHFLRTLRIEGRLNESQAALLESGLKNSYNHFAPENDPRFVVFEDRGSLVDELLVSPTFHGTAPDYLTHIVVTGYLGREFMLDLVRTSIENNKSTKTFLPLAQHPGIGLAEIGQLIVTKLKDGLEEHEAASLLKLPSGSIERYLDISASKTGLERLLELLFPGSHARITSSIESSGLQSEYYILEGGQNLTTRVTSVRPVEHAGQLNSTEFLGELALDDCGLLFHENGIVRVGNEFTVITQLSERSGIKTQPKHFKDIENKPEPTYNYSRQYTIVLKDEQSDINPFVVEKPISACENRFAGVLLQATIRRDSDGFVQHSIDQEPTPEFYNAKSKTPLNPKLSVERTFRNVLILNLPITSSTQKNEPELLKLLATLASTLQAVVSLSFPSLAKRLAVFPIHETDDTFQSKYHSFMGSMCCLFPSGKTVGEYTRNILSTADQISDGTELQHPFSIMIVEDGEHDLGACRSMADNMDKMIDRWHRYLQWATQSSSWHVQDKIEPLVALESECFQNDQ